MPPHTETGWEVHAPSLTGVLQWVQQRYGNLPLYISENSAALSRAFGPAKP